MSSPISYAHDGAVAVITVDNPPVNALSQPVREGLSKAVTRFEGDRKARAAVIVGAGRTFFAGADIKEFGKPLAAPGLPGVVNQIEACSKPVIAALHGTALGGGFEVALGMPLPGGCGVRQGRPAGGQSGHPARCRRHPACAAACRCRCGG